MPTKTYIIEEFFCNQWDKMRVFGGGYQYSTTNKEYAINTYQHLSRIHYFPVRIIERTDEVMFQSKEVHVHSQSWV